MSELTYPFDSTIVFTLICVFLYVFRLKTTQSFPFVSVGTLFAIIIDYLYLALFRASFALGTGNALSSGVNATKELTMEKMIAELVACFFESFDADGMNWVDPLETYLEDEGFEIMSPDADEARDDWFVVAVRTYSGENYSVFTTAEQFPRDDYRRYTVTQ
jgi:hypothetical protein